MRDNIYEIYKSLAGFKISITEIDKIAHAYKRWLTCPQGAGINYGNVYYHDGMLYSIPYYPAIEDLHYKLVGIEINGLIYLKGYEMNIHRNSIPKALAQLKEYVFNERVCNGTTPDFEIRIPTITETDNLLKRVRNNFKEELNLCPIYGKYWVCSDDDEKTKLAEIGPMDSGYLKASLQSAAIVIPVVEPRTNAFIGVMDEYGIPSSDTTKTYEKLCALASEQ